MKASALGSNLYSLAGSGSGWVFSSPSPLTPHPSRAGSARVAMLLGLGWLSSILPPYLLARARPVFSTQLSRLGSLALLNFLAWVAWLYSTFSPGSLLPSPTPGCWVIGSWLGIKILLQRQAAGFILLFSLLARLYSSPSYLSLRVFSSPSSSTLCPGSHRPASRSPRNK